MDFKSEIYEATCSAPVNIACIKYWGKREPLSLILPINSSLSVTLSQDDLRSVTTVRASENFKQDRLWLNGKEEQVLPEGRTGICIRELRKLRSDMEKNDHNLPRLSTFPIHIVSINNFPTAAGLASSASGFAALAFTIYTLYSLSSAQISLSSLSRIARQGSGSACRSIFGGFVAWEMGFRPDGTDSLAVQVAPREHWPQMEALICVVSDLKKETSSTTGMQRTVETSSLLQQRITQTVPQRMKEITSAILDKDFERFAELTMRDSNQFHAVCMDTSPPIYYMNDVSRAIVAVINDINHNKGKIVAAYTFDAGPNAVIYALKKDMGNIKAIIARHFIQEAIDALPAGPQKINGSSPFKGSVSRLIHTKIGDGPRILGKHEGLIGN